MPDRSSAGTANQITTNAIASDIGAGQRRGASIGSALRTFTPDAREPAVSMTARDLGDGSFSTKSAVESDSVRFAFSSTTRATAASRGRVTRAPISATTLALTAAIQMTCV